MIETQVKNTVSLYAVEENLLALLDSEVFVTPEAEAEFKLDLAQAVKSAAEKREATALFILQMEANAKFAREEAKRITERGRMFENVAERVRDYVLTIIENQEPDAKGKLPKLEGTTTVMYARALPKNVEIVDPEAVPVGFKNVSLTLPGAKWESLLEALEKADAGGQGDGELIPLVVRAAAWSTDNAKVKAAVKAGEIVPGVETIVGGSTLVVK